MYGTTLIISVIFIGGLTAYLGDRIGMKVGKNRLTLWGLRPKYTSIIITILTGVLIALLSGGLMMAASQRARIALFRLDEILTEIKIAQAELSYLRADKARLEQEADNLAHNLKLFGDKYITSLKGEVIYKRGAEVTKIRLKVHDKEQIRIKLREELKRLDAQIEQIGAAELKYNKKELAKLVSILAQREEEVKVVLRAAQNIFSGEELVVKFDVGGFGP